MHKSKKILIYCGHPAQYLFFRNAIKKLKNEGYQIKLLLKEKDVLEALVQADGNTYKRIQKSRGNKKINIIMALFHREFKMLGQVFRFRPALLLGTDPSLAHIGRLLNIPCITTLEDDKDVIPRLTRITYPHTKYIFTPNVCDVGDEYKHKKMSYEGYMKLAYLHPKYFKADESIVTKYTQGKKYVLIRLSGLKAHHDEGIKGVESALLKKIIALLKSDYAIYFSTEEQIPTELQQYAFPAPPDTMHHFLAYASMFISDSQSMSVEAALLGVPNLRISAFSGRISVLEELEKKYQLTKGFLPNDDEAILQTIEGYTENPNLRKEWNAKREKMLSEKVDVTELLCETIKEKVGK